MTRGSVEGIAEDVLDGVTELGLLGLADIILDAGVKAVLVSVPVGLMVAGTLVVGMTGVGVWVGTGSVVLSLTRGGGVKVGVSVGGGDGV